MVIVFVCKTQTRGIRFAKWYSPTQSDAIDSGCAGRGRTYEIYGAGDRNKPTLAYSETVLEPQERRFYETIREFSNNKS